VLVSRTVADLVAGSGLVDRGIHKLKGSERRFATARMIGRDRLKHEARDHRSKQSIAKPMAEPASAFQP